MNKVLISIVMPVYNGEKLLRSSIDSVVSQTASNWELILVDDGSTDSSNKICVEYANSDKRINLFSIDNSGPAIARNTGLNNASGDYCIFIDSDDLLENKAIEKLTLLVLKQELDVVFYGYYTGLLNEDNYITKSVVRGEKQLHESNKSFKSSFEKMHQIGFTHPVWNKMFNLNLIRKHNIKFPKGLNISEDFIFNLQVYELAESVLITSEVLYHYVNHTWGSITTRFDEHKILAIHKVFKMSNAIMNRWNPRFTGLVNNEYIGNISVYINSMFNKDCLLTYQSKRKKVIVIINNNQVKSCLNNFIPHNIRNRIIAILLRLKQPDLLLMTGKISRLLKA